MKREREAQIIEIKQGYSWALDEIVNNIVSIGEPYFNLQNYVNGLISSMTIGFCEDLDNTLYIYTHDGNAKINYFFDGDILVVESVFLYIIK